MCFNSCKPPGDMPLQQGLSPEGCLHCGTQHFQHKGQKLTRTFGWINCSDSNLKTLKAGGKGPQDSSPRGEALGAASCTEDLGKMWGGGEEHLHISLKAGGLLQFWKHTATKYFPTATWTLPTETELEFAADPNGRICFLSSSALLWKPSCSVPPRSTLF